MYWEYGLAMAIQYFNNSVTKMSECTGINIDRLNYLRNRNARKILLEEALIIDVEIEGAVRWYQLVPQVDSRVKLRINGKTVLTAVGQPNLSDSRPFSQRVFEAMAYEEKYLKQRQGQRTDLQLRENSHEVGGRTDRYLVTTFLLGSEWNYRKAKKVMQGGIFELIQSMDDWLPISLAVALTLHSREEQEKIFKEKTKDEVIAYARSLIKKNKK